MMALAFAETCLVADLWTPAWQAIELSLTLSGFAAVMISPFISSLGLPKKIWLCLGAALFAAALMILGLILGFLYVGDIPGPAD
jgi:hypothetical protein